MPPAQTQLTLPRVVGNFRDGFDAAGSVERVRSYSIDSIAQSFENQHAFLEGNPLPEEQKGGVEYAVLAERRISLRSVKYNNGLEFDSDVVDKDETGDIDNKIRGLGGTFALWHELEMLKLLEAGATTSEGVFTGANYFSSTGHVLGKQSAQINDVTVTQVGALDVVNPAAPTPEEFVDAIVGGIGYMSGFLGAFGDPLHMNAKDFIVYVPTQFAGAAITAASANNLAQGKTSTVVALKADGFNIDVVPAATLSRSVNAFYILRRDSQQVLGHRALIWQNDVGFTAGPKVTLIDKTDEEDKIRVRGKWLGKHGFGYPLDALRLTLST